MKSISSAASVALPLIMARGSRRAESAGVKTRAFDEAHAVVATMRLNMGTPKGSCAPHEEEYRRLYGAGR
ncbi:hypothetical protein FXV83_36715 [Bradyrhizobium hipponense]|uniref:Uncharacterized protein n=1 Tax=Bradyrhizobium hipponense TaxID=2605638 RepID=A0A5S4YMY5_9BRAD|nr:hypothetical protein FXV83_36715 [Bradyrhizobium hipponense]